MEWKGAEMENIESFYRGNDRWLIWLRAGIDPVPSGN